MEGTRYGVISSKKWRIFAARVGGSQSRTVKFSQTFACDDPDFPVRALHLYLLHLADSEPWLDPVSRPINPPDREWLQKSETALHAGAEAAATSASKAKPGDKISQQRLSGSVGCMARPCCSHITDAWVGGSTSSLWLRLLCVSQASKLSAGLCDWPQGWDPPCVRQKLGALVFSAFVSCCCDFAGDARGEGCHLACMAGKLLMLSACRELGV